MRERRNYLLLMGLIAAAVIGAAFLAIPGSPLYIKPTLGLDLQGGLEVVLKAIPDRGQTINAAQMQTAQNIMINRVDTLGVASPSVAIQGNDEIVIQLAGVHNPAKAAAIVGSTGKLQFFDFEKDLAPPTVNNGNPTPYPTLFALLTAVKGEAKKGTPESYYLFGTTIHVTHPRVKGKKTTKKTPEKNVVKAGPDPTQKQLLAKYGGKQPPGTTILAVPANREVVSGPNQTSQTQPVGASPNGIYWYLFKYYPTAPNGPPELTGNDLNESAITADTATNGDGQPEVVLGFSSHGQKEFTRITKAEWDRGRLVAGLAGSSGQANPLYWQHNAIVLDGKLRATPYIDYTNTSFEFGIVGGATIGDMGTLAAAQNLALVLQSGSLPYTFQHLAENDVSATLGKSSLHQAIVAALAGLIVVALVLLLLYRFLGLVAVLGLAIYGLLYYAAILIFGVTLTLPGFAGLILTIGVAADANVVVFERIKEEVRAGKSVRSAISTGYGKGFHTILDANVVTAITAVVLFLIAVADVKGFALMLLIGTMISLLTAVAATRAMLGLLSGFRWFDNPRFMGAKSESIPRWQQIDINSRRRRRIFLGVATAAIVLSIVAIAVQGLNLGIDFRGGTLMSFGTRTAEPTSAVQSVFAKDGRPDAVVQGVGVQTGSTYSQFQVKSKHLTVARQTKITSDLRTQAGMTGTPNVTTVSSTFSSQIAHDGILAVIVSFLLIAIYIAMRFQWRFAVPILRTLFNDILITLGVYAISGREVTISTVAAVLTVLGYSIYDTIIVFDRIRENMPLMRRAPFSAIANVSVAETLRRSMTTSGLTLIPIVCLFVFGGTTLKDFAFALLVGISLGAVSTIFVATPFLTVLMERSPEFAHRVSGDDVGFSGVALPPSLRRALGRGDAVDGANGGGAAPEKPELAEVKETVAAPGPAEPDAQDRREKRSQRRRSRPHGRTR